MGRVPFGKASKGSQKWIQDIINERPELINQSIIKKIDQIEIQWLSPLKEDDHAEYKDEEFLHKLGVELTNRELKEFWPTRGGPQWDALGKSNSSKVFLVEAKSHIGEINSPGTGAKSEKSKELITNSLREVKHYLNVRNDVDWSRYFYQYTNRLAHLYFLRVLNSIDAYLVFV